MTRGLWPAFAAALAVLGAAVAHAQDGPSAQQSAAARALFEEGVELADRGEWQDAADRFARSLSLRESPVVAYNLASALVHVDRLVEASELLQGVVRDESAPAAARDAARALLDQVQPRLARLTVHLEGDPTGAALVIDERVIPSEMVGVAVPADPGIRFVRAVRDEDIVAEQEVDLAEGSSAEVRLEVPPPPARRDPGFRPGEALRSDLPDPLEPEDGEASRTAERAHVQVRRPRRPRTPAPEPESDSILTEAWFWIGVGALVVLGAGIGIGVAIGSADEVAPGVNGTADPPLIELGR
jgi:hypothetical protein